MRLGVRSKLFLVTLGLLTVSMVAADAYLSAALGADLTARVQADLLIRLSFVEREASSVTASLEDCAAWDHLADDLGRRGEVRVSIIRQDGRLLGDSELELAELERVDSHAGRPEITEALALRQGAATRWSRTVQQRMMYVAAPFTRAGSVAGVVRLAKPLTEVDEALAHGRRGILTSTGIALALATLLLLLASHWMSGRVRWLTEAARRMAAGALELRTRATGQDELAELGRALDGLAASLQEALHSVRAERDLRDRVLEGMHEGVLLLDEDGRIALANTALRSALRLEAEVVGRTPLEVVRNAALERLLAEASLAQGPISGELELDELEPRRLLVHAAALREPPKGVLAVVVDITALRRLETLRRDFVANVSHELRTPVSAVQAAAETLRRTLETQPEAAADFVEIIERNASRLRLLIDDLLDLSRIESQKFKLELQTVSVHEAARRVMAQSLGRATSAGVDLCSTIGADAPAVRADERALEQVLGNLVDNALKYCPRGASVLLRVERSDGGLRVVVEDTGPGIERRHLARLFERFYRVDGGRSRELGGTGLGLAIVKHLVEAMQGQVGVESILGEGSRFSFTLPLA